MTRRAGATSVGAVVRFLDGLALRSAGDRELLGRFAATRDEAAFRVLTERHGPMVLGVCRRVLGNDADAEDAFQATFLVLARQAGSIRKADGLASWLHGVARRVATKLRRARRRRARHEQAVLPPPGRPPLDELTWAEVKAGLDDELARLPAEYREVLILCYLEGLTRDEAARRLGVAVGVVKGRLERARKLLAERMAGRGLDLSACLLPAALSPEVVTVAVRAAAGLAASGGLDPVVNEILTGMAMAKLKRLGVATCALLLAVGIGVGMARQPAGALPPVSAGWAGNEEAFLRRPEAPPLTLPEPVRAARWSGDGRAMATLSSRTDTVDGKEVTLSRFRVWDASTGKLKADLGELEYRGLNSYGLSADGKVFALSTRGRLDVGDRVELWDAEKGALLRTIEMEYGRSRVWFSFAPDGGSLAVCGSDVQGDRLVGTVRLFDTATGKPTRKLVSDGDITISVAYSADGKAVAAGGALGEITVWDVATGKITRSLKAGGAVAAVAFSPDGKRLVAGGREAPVAVWDLATGKDRPLKGDAFAAEHLAFSPDGRYVAGLAAQAKRDEKEGVWKHAVRVWKAESGEVLHEWHTTGYGVAFSPDGREVRFLDGPTTVMRVGLAGE